MRTKVLSSLCIIQPETPSRALLQLITNTTTCRNPTIISILSFSGSDHIMSDLPWFYTRIISTQFSLASTAHHVTEHPKSYPLCPLDHLVVHHPNRAIKLTPKLASVADIMKNYILLAVQLDEHWE